MSKLFTRKASGIVREASAFDLFVFNSGCGALLTSVGWLLILGPAFYYGGDILLSTIITAVGCIFGTLCYYFFVVAMPRSGGDYVFISRSLNPVLAFVLSWGTFVWGFFFAATGGAFGTYVGLATLMDIIGTRTQIQALTSFGLWLQDPVGYFIVTSFFLVIFALLLMSGLRTYLRVNNVMIGVSILGALVLVALLLSSNNTIFVNAWDKNFAPLTYNGIIESAKSAGWFRADHIDSTQTMFLMIWPYWAVGWMFFGVCIGGETKNIKRSSLIGIFGSWIFITVLLVITVVAAINTIGYDFLGAISYNWYVDPANSTATIPWVGALASVLTDNLLAIVLIALSFTFFSLFWIPAWNLWNSRVIFAWSIDRVMPDIVSYVHPKTRTPIVALIIGAIISEIFLYLISFTPYLGLQSGIIPLIVSIMFVCISAIVFPYRKREIFEKSPANYRVGGVPLMSICGLIGAVYLGILIVTTAYDPMSGAIPNVWVFGSIIGVYAAGAIIFYLARYLRKRQGILVDLAYQEIPIE